MTDRLRAAAEAALDAMDGLATYGVYASLPEEFRASFDAARDELRDARAALAEAEDEAWEADYEVRVDTGYEEMWVAGADDVKDALHYAAQYTDEGTVRVYERHKRVIATLERTEDSVRELRTDGPRAALAEPEDTRVCTCHPDDNPPQPCPRQYALDECRRVALAEPQQEPVAWADEVIDELQSLYDTDGIEEQGTGDALIRLSDAVAAVEAAAKSRPPRREWKGLTDEEREQFVQWMHPDVLERVEAALRAKNGGGA